jgi:hypothetical protein
MALKDLVISEEDLREQWVYFRRRANRFERELRTIAQAKLCTADHLREIAAKAIRKKRVVKK